MAGLIIKERERAANFTPNEKEIVLLITSKYKDIIEDKSTKALMVDKKNKVWLQVEREFNNCSKNETGLRTAKQLKDLYGNLKREQRRNALEHQKLDHTIIKQEIYDVQESNEEVSNGPEPEPTRRKFARKCVKKRAATADDLRRQYYREKIRNERFQRTILGLQIKKLKLEINKLQQ